MLAQVVTGNVVARGTPGHVAGAASLLAKLNQAPANGCATCLVRARGFCAAASLDGMDELTRHHRQVTRRAGEALTVEGERAATVHVVRAGAIRLAKSLSDGRRQIVGFALPGDVIGLAPGGSYVYDAEAVGETVLCSIPAADLERVAQREPGFAKRLYALAGQELTAAYDQMLLLGRKAATEKVASFLLRLSERQVERGRPASPVAVPMSGEDIADYLGLRIETVSRCLSRLRSAGLIGPTKDSRIELRDADGLQDAACGELETAKA